MLVKDGYAILLGTAIGNIDVGVPLAGIEEKIGLLRQRDDPAPPTARKETNDSLGSPCGDHRDSQWSSRH